MWKGIAVATAALALAGSAFVAAQAQTQLFQPQRPQPGLDQPVMPGVAPGTFARWELNAEDMRAFGEARLAGLKAGLALTPEQEKNWPAFEEAAREFAKLRSDRRDALRNSQPAADPAERLRRRANEMSETGAAMKKLADAIDPLYKSFDEGQKRRFAMLSRFGRSPGMGGPGFEFRGPDRGGMRMHRGDRRGGGGDDEMMERDHRDGRGGRDDRDGRGGRDL